MEGKQYALINEQGHYLRIITTPSTPPYGIIINNKIRREYATRFQSQESMEEIMNKLLKMGAVQSGSIQRLYLTEIEPSAPEYETEFSF